MGRLLHLRVVTVSPGQRHQTPLHPIDGGHRHFAAEWIDPLEPCFQVLIHCSCTAIWVGKGARLDRFDEPLGRLEPRPSLGKMST